MQKDPDYFEERAHDIEEILDEAERFEVQQYDSTLMFRLAEDDVDPRTTLVSRSRILTMMERQLEAGGAVFIGGIH